MKNLSKKILLALLMTNTAYVSTSMGMDSDSKEPLLGGDSHSPYGSATVAAAPLVRGSIGSPFKGTDRTFSERIKTEIEEYVDNHILTRRGIETVTTAAPSVQVDAFSPPTTPRASQTIPTYRLVDGVVKTNIAEIIHHARWLANLTPESYAEIGKDIMKTRVRYTRKFLEMLAASVFVPNYNVVMDKTSRKFKSADAISALASERELEAEDVEIIKADAVSLMQKNSVPGISVGDTSVTRKPSKVRATRAIDIEHTFGNYVDIVEAFYQIAACLLDPTLLHKEIAFEVNYDRNDEPAREKIKYNGFSHFFDFTTLGITDPDTIRAGVYAAQYVIYKRTLARLAHNKAALHSRYQAAVTLINSPSEMRMKAHFGASSFRPLKYPDFIAAASKLDRDTSHTTGILSAIEKRAQAGSIPMPTSARDLSSRLYRSINVALKLLKPHQASLTVNTAAERLANFMLPHLDDAGYTHEDRSLSYSGSYSTAAGYASLPKTSFGISDIDKRIAMLGDLVDALNKVEPLAS